MTWRVALIVGVEGESSTGALANDALVTWPTLGTVYLQPKTRPSPLEPAGPKFRRSDLLHVFRGTALGNVATLVCSDYYDPAVWGELLLRTPDLDALIVPCRNPHQRLFQLQADSDAARFNVSIVLVNTVTPTPKGHREPAPLVSVHTPWRDGRSLEQGGSTLKARGPRGESCAVRVFELPIVEQGKRSYEKRSNKLWPVAEGRKIL